MHRNRHIAASVLTLGLWFPAWKALSKAHHADQPATMQYWQTVAVAWLMTVIAVLAGVFVVVGIVQADGDRASAIGIEKTERIPEAAASDAGPQSFTKDLIIDTAEADVVSPATGPLPNGTFAQASVIAKGTDVPMQKVAEQCATYMADEGTADADGGMCVVYADQTSYDSKNAIGSYVGEYPSISLLGNMCYSMVAWHQPGGSSGFVDAAAEDYWYGIGCEGAAGGGAA